MQSISLDEAQSHLAEIIDKLPPAYNNVPAIFRSVEKKTSGQGGLFWIFVSDLCKGCGECVQVCGQHRDGSLDPEFAELTHSKAVIVARKPAPR